MSLVCVCGFGGVNALCEVWRQSVFIEPETLDKLRKDGLSIRNRVLWDCYSNCFFLVYLGICRSLLA